MLFNKFEKMYVSFTLNLYSYVMVRKHYFCQLKIRRLGGAYGGKFSHSIHACAVSAICANKLNRPVKFVMDMKANMETYGKRSPYLVKWKVK